MDPNKTMYMIAEYLSQKNYRFALESAQDLLEWIKKGGFLPTGWIAENDSVLLVPQNIREQTWFVDQLCRELVEAGENRQWFAEALQAFCLEGFAYIEGRRPPDGLKAYQVELNNPYEQKQEYGYSDLPRFELEWRIIYACVVAGKSAQFTRNVMQKLFTEQSQKTPLFFFSAMIKAKSLEEVLREAKTGNYNKLVKTFTELTQAVLENNLDLSTCSPQELEAIHGIGPKTSRFFILWTREGVRVAALDVHILRWLRELGYNAPKNTPQSAKRYRELEEAFLAEAHRLNMEPRDLDYAIWSRYSGDEEFQPDERKGKEESGKVEPKKNKGEK